MDINFAIIWIGIVASLIQVGEFIYRLLTNKTVTKKVKVIRIVMLVGCVILTIGAMYFEPFKSSDDYYKDAVQYQDRGNLPRAIVSAQKAIKKDDTNRDAHRLLASCYGLQGVLDKSIAEFNKAININPLDPISHLGIAKAYQESGDLDNAKYHYGIVVHMSTSSSKETQYARERLSELKEEAHK